MIIFSILFLLLSNAVTLRRDKSLLFSRVGILILLSATIVVFQSLYFTNLASGIGLFGGLYHATTITHVFQCFILLIGSVVLLLLGNPSIIVRITEYSSIQKLMSYPRKINIRIRECSSTWKLFSYIFIAPIIIFLVSTAGLVSMLFYVVFIGLVGFYYSLILVLVKQHKEKEIDIGYLCSFKQFFSLLKKLKRCYYTIIRAVKNKYCDSTRKEIIFLVLRKICIFALIFCLGFCFTKNNLNILLFFLRFLACFIFVIILPYLYYKYEKDIIYYIENKNVQCLIYNFVYKYYLPLSIGIVFVIIMYLVTTIFHWEIFFLEHIIYMWPSQGGSMWGGGGSMGNGNSGPQGQPPQRPPTPGGEIIAYNKPDNEEKRWRPEYKKPINTYETHIKVEEFIKNNPTSYVPVGSSVFFNPEIHGNTDIGFYKNTNKSHSYRYFMYSFHDRPVIVYDTSYRFSCIMPETPLPKGFYFYQRTGYCKSEFFPADFNIISHRNKDLYVRTNDGQYIPFPFKLPNNIVYIKSYENAS